MAAVELPDRGIQCYERASHYRQVNGEVAAFVMQEAEAQLLVTKQPLGYAVSRKALVRAGLEHPLAREPVATIFRDCDQPEGLMNSETEGLIVAWGSEEGRASAPIFATATGLATSERGQVAPEAGSR
jgi:hypothetical protein